MGDVALPAADSLCVLTQGSAAGSGGAHARPRLTVGRRVRASSRQRRCKKQTRSSVRGGRVVRGLWVHQLPERVVGPPETPGLGSQVSGLRSQQRDQT